MELTNELWVTISTRLPGCPRWTAELILKALPDAPGLKEWQCNTLRMIAAHIHQRTADRVDAEFLDNLARRPAAQAQEPQSMPAVEHFHKWVNGHCYNENCSALQPTVEQEADGDWLDRVLPVEPTRADVANVLSIVRDIGKGYGLFQELNEGVVWHVCRNYTSICRARLTAPQKPDPAVEAVKRPAAELQWNRYSVSSYNGGQHDFFTCPICFATIGGCNSYAADENKERHIQWHKGDDHTKPEAH